ncbi:Asp-tRNA(Asn)/Glu-tRNA(Gln) amidotransferase A subunit family amidase [Actinokineospora baliensis]|uniref:amidase family protein n=1 Tax=Actinokineospora baliensis TaxID=547056 RepID=UPI0019595F1D|nr:amidase [Actinokineospora baliensis]MBM7774779.1 Asp-tRNA(Asn)/Glu-tRNA(Gln) amidotransferase A subunit family amidase [Actinokineospora baliensis]
MTTTTSPAAEADAPRPVPPLVTEPLRERLRRADAGDFPAAAWRDELTGWSREADARYRACVYLRPVPESPLPIAVGVKDTFDVAGMPTTWGMRRYRHHPRTSAAALDGLAAAAVTAKLVTTEINIGIGSGCVNPYLPDIDPTGSSTGPAVAVAAGICDLGLGSDVIGSIRAPAGRCGLVGLRTTHDPARLVGLLPLAPTMDTVGWITRTADDLAVLWNRLGLGPGVVGDGRTRRRIGIVADGQPAPAVAASVAHTAGVLREAGHETVAVDLGDLWRWRGAAWELCARSAHDLLREITGEVLDPLTLNSIEFGAGVARERADEVLAAQPRLRALAADLFAAAGVDAWLMPLDADLPRRRGKPPTQVFPSPDLPDFDHEIGYNPVASIAGLPAMACPVGITDDGIPLSVQLVGPRNSDAVLIELGRELAPLRPAYHPR